jgi:hypothetical protein
MKIQDKDDERILSLCGTILNRQKLLYCEMCGAVMGPACYLEFIKKRTRSVARVAADRHLCDLCARKSTAKFSADEAPVKKT